MRLESIEPREILKLMEILPEEDRRFLTNQMILILIDSGLIEEGESLMDSFSQDRYSRIFLQIKYVTGYVRKGEIERAVDYVNNSVDIWQREYVLNMALASLQECEEWKNMLEFSRFIEDPVKRAQWVVNALSMEGAKGYPGAKEMLENAVSNLLDYIKRLREDYIDSIVPCEKLSSLASDFKSVMESIVSSMAAYYNLDALEEGKEVAEKCIKYVDEMLWKLESMDERFKRFERWIIEDLKKYKALFLYATGKRKEALEIFKIPETAKVLCNEGSWLFSWTLFKRDRELEEILKEDEYTYSCYLYYITYLRHSRGLDVGNDILEELVRISFERCDNHEPIYYILSVLSFYKFESYVDRIIEHCRLDDGEIENLIHIAQLYGSAGNVEKEKEFLERAYSLIAEDMELDEWARLMAQIAISYFRIGLREKGISLVNEILERINSLEPELLENYREKLRDSLAYLTLNLVGIWIEEKLSST